MNYLTILVAYGLASMPLSASAYTVNTDKYFAYFEKPMKRRGGLAIPGEILLLSKQKCSAKGAPKSAKIGSIVYTNVGGYIKETPACWYFEENRGDKIVVLCSTFNNEMEPGAGACRFVSPSRFLDVDSLPRSADLQ